MDAGPCFTAAAPGPALRLSTWPAPAVGAGIGQANASGCKAWRPPSQARDHCNPSPPDSCQPFLALTVPSLRGAQRRGIGGRQKQSLRPLDCHAASAARNDGAPTWGLGQRAVRMTPIATDPDRSAHSLIHHREKRLPRGMEQSRDWDATLVVVCGHAASVAATAACAYHPVPRAPGITALARP